MQFKRSADLKTVKSHAEIRKDANFSSMEIVKILMGPASGKRLHQKTVLKDGDQINMTSIN